MLYFHVDIRKRAPLQYFDMACSFNFSGLSLRRALKYCHHDLSNETMFPPETGYKNTDQRGFPQGKRRSWSLSLTRHCSRLVQSWHGFDGQPYSQLLCHFQSKIIIFDGQLFYKIEYKNSRAFLPNVVRWTEPDNFMNYKNFSG